jgi:uncharacterized protein YkwD
MVRTSAFVAAVTGLAPLLCLADPVDLVNATRMQGCGEFHGVATVLRRDARLDEAARRVASGEVLREALAAAGYRIKKTASIEIRTDKGETRIAEILASHFCDDVTNRAFRDIGLFQSGYDTRMIIAQPFVPPRPDQLAAVADQVLKLVNIARLQARQCGEESFPATTQLAYSSVLESAALAHARDMAVNDFIGHFGSDGETPDTRASRAGYRWRSIGENVAAGQTSAREVVDGWLASPSHCSTLMDPRYTETGVAFAVDLDGEHGVYWAQAFGRPR